MSQPQQDDNAYQRVEGQPQTRKVSRAVTIGAVFVGLAIVGLIAYIVYFQVTKKGPCSDKNVACCDPKKPGPCSCMMLTLPSGQIWGDQQCQNTPGLANRENSFCTYGPNPSSAKQEMAAICVNPQTVFFPPLRSKTTGKWVQANNEPGQKTIRLQSCASCNRSAYFCPIYMKANSVTGVHDTPVYLNETTGKIGVTPAKAGSYSSGDGYQYSNDDEYRKFATLPGGEKVQPCFEYPEDQTGTACVPTTGHNVEIRPGLKCNDPKMKECGYINPDGTINDYSNTFAKIESPKSI